MYDLYPDDWRGPEPFKALVDTPLPPDEQRRPCDCPESGVCPCSCHDRQLVDQKHAAPVKARLSHYTTLREIADDRGTTARTRMQALRIMHRLNTHRPEGL